MMRTGLWLLLAGCGSGLTSTNVNKDGDFEEEVDELAPVIVHTAVTETQTFGEDVAIEATVTDEGSGVLFVYLYYKNETDGSADWTRSILTPNGDIYTGTIQGEDQRGSGVDYYLEAVDKQQNTSWAPEDGDDDPYHFRVAE